MPVSRSLRRLLRIRDLQEHKSRMELDSALGELNVLERALAAAALRDNGGRRFLDAGARSGDLADRLAGLEESRAAGRHSASLGPKIADALEEVAEFRREFLVRRIERRQAETLIEEEQVRDAIDLARRSQQALDDWHGARRHRKADAATLRPSSVRPARRET